jgi:carboxypeptidase T
VWQRVNVIGPDREAMADLVRVHRVSVVRQTLRERPDGRWRVEAFGDDADLAGLPAAGYAVEVIEAVPAAPPPPLGVDATAGAGPPTAPRGRPAGGPGGYMSVAAVDRWLAEAGGPANGELTELIALPHRTWDDRRCLALRIGPGDRDGVAGICLLGGVHAREWGSADILVAFADRLLEARRAGKGIAIGRRRVSAARVEALLAGTNIYIVPQVNPDGRHHSLTVDPMWRKNRRPGPAGAPPDGSCVGVDLNRNYDFLWDIERSFAPDAPVASSTHPCDRDVYVGPAAASEPETRNVVWLLDEHPDIGFLVDVHSYGELILHCWGDDQNQARRRAQTFGNPAWDGHRGRPGDDYGEFLAAADRKLMERLARKMQSGIAGARGRRYTIQQSMDLYPTAGTADDYAYSRHLVDPARPKILAFTVEWGAEDNPTPFHPPYPEMAKILNEMTSGLLAFCAEALRVSAARHEEDD